MSEFTTAHMYAAATRLASAMCQARSSAQASEIVPDSQNRAMAARDAMAVVVALEVMLDMLPDDGRAVFDRIQVLESRWASPALSASPDPEEPF